MKILKRSQAHALMILLQQDPKIFHIPKPEIQNENKYLVKKSTKTVETLYLLVSTSRYTGKHIICLEKLHY